MRPIDIVEWRHEHKVKQAELAKELGKSRQTVVNWERGHTRLPDNLQGELERLARLRLPGQEKKPRSSVTPERRAEIMADLNTRRPSFQLMTDEEKHVWFSNK